ncbi:hypothetical protein J6590_086725 [Homalodisca vitripennis]|nr:hypothetical protein J6590_091002 [Homalodisca vitripennis]KAG8265787.1 hypothetical protein J6590_086725 [Homalodisca vitripennis]
MPSVIRSSETRSLVERLFLIEQDLVDWRQRYTVSCDLLNSLINKLNDLSKCGSEVILCVRNSRQLSIAAWISTTYDTDFARMTAQLARSREENGRLEEAIIALLLWTPTETLQPDNRPSGPPLNGGDFASLTDSLLAELTEAETSRDTPAVATPPGASRLATDTIPTRHPPSALSVAAAPTSSPVPRSQKPFRECLGYWIFSI